MNEEKLFKQLAWKCMQNNISFTSTTLNGSTKEIDIFLIENGEHVFESRAYIRAHWMDVDPIESLNKLHNDLDDYLEQRELDESITDEEFVTERPKLLTINELRMANAGHRMKDFM